MQNPQHEIESLRSLVRYVDQDLAVIELHAALAGPAPRQPKMLVRMTGPDGSERTFRGKLQPEPAGRGWTLRFELPRPQRWWPAGMGEQVLYEMRATLLAEDEASEGWQLTTGLTSVRAPDPSLREGVLVNGQAREIRTLLAIEPEDESGLLPAGGDALLVVRDHFGPDVLYEAADRAGLLLIQSIADPSQAAAQIDRLSAHPSLAGWLIDRIDRAAEAVARRVRRLDPTRIILRGDVLASGL